MADDADRERSRCFQSPSTFAVDAAWDGRLSFLAAADVSLVSLPLLTGGTFFEEAMTGTGDSGAVPGGDLSN